MNCIIGHTCKGLSVGVSSLLLCPLWMLDGKVKRRPISDPGPRTIFAEETKMKF